MAMFKSNPITATAKDLANAQANADRLAARLVASEDAVVARRHEAEQLALDGADDRALDKAEGALRAALDRQSTIAAASAEAAKLVALLETRLGDLRDKATRATTAAEVEQMATDIEEIADALIPLMTRLAEVTGRADAAQIWSSSSLHAFATACCVQIPDGINLVSQAMREFSVRILDGREARATLLTAPAPAKTVTVAEPPVVLRVFTLQNIKWTVDGRVMTASKFCDVDLPPETAKRALASRACAPTDSDVRRQWAGSRPMTHPDPAECVSVDGATIVALDAPVVDGQFTRLDRGPAYQAEFRKA